MRGPHAHAAGRSSSRPRWSSPGLDETARAVTAYQRKHGLPATGVVTTEVWDSLT
jgi:hypothetical protein